MKEFLFKVSSYYYIDAENIAYDVKGYFSGNMDVTPENEKYMLSKEDVYYG